MLKDTRLTVKFPYGGHDITALMKNADDAMYEAKFSGKNQFKFANKNIVPYSKQQLEQKT